MAIGDGEILLGLNFVGKRLRAIEGEIMGEQVRIKSVAESRLDLPFDQQTIENEDYIPTFSSAINKLLDEQSILANSAHFALDRRMVFLKRITIDKGLNEEQIRNHIEWEIEQWLAASRNEFNVIYDKERSDFGQSDTVLIAAVRKRIIDYLKRIFVRTPLTLKVVDIDVLAAIRGLMGNRPKPDRLAALIDIHKNLDILLAKDGKFAYLNEAGGEKENNLENAEKMANRIHEELLKIFKEYAEEFGSLNLDTIYLSGDKADVEVIPYLQQLQKNADIRFADPFERVELATGTELDPLIKNNPEKFLISVGMIIH
jgi:Tfp pilus assembly PilM family ATPase